MKKHKLVISSYDDLNNPFYGGGGAYAIERVAEKLVRKYKVSVITGKYPGSRDEVKNGIRYKRIGVSLFGAKFGQLIYHIALPFKVMREDHDVWIESFTPPHSTSLVPLFTKKPVIGLAHMLAGDDMKRKYKIPFNIIERFGLKFYKYFVVLNESDKKKIERVNNNSVVTIIPNGVDQPERKTVKKGNYILFVGRIEIDQKGLDVLLKSFKQISKRLNNVKLKIAGYGTTGEENKLKLLIKSLGLEENVELIGRVNEGERDLLYRKALLVVVPSRYETFSLVALEAASYGLPIVCFDIYGLKWLPDRVVRKVKKIDAMKLSEAILEVYRDKSLQIHLGKNAKNLSKTYEWNDIVFRYEQFIDSVINKFSPKTGIKFQTKGDSNLLLDRIISEKLHCVFVSPHLDDAVYSAGGLLLKISGIVPIKIINVFTASGAPPFTLSAKKHHKICGYDNADSLDKARLTEDKAIMNKLGAEVNNLNFVDSLYRKRHISFPVTFISKIIPEFGHIYPTYRYHVLSGKISKHDSILNNRLADKLKKIVGNDNKSVVFCPLGVGNHVDHVIVRKACEKAFGVIVYWEDFPYLDSDEKLEDALSKNKSVEIVKVDRKKLLLMSGYQTQIKTLEKKLRPEKFIYSNNHQDTEVSANNRTTFNEQYYYGESVAI